ncbi:penicillin-binding transpeptidase domain-containing protein, partial [Enorma phocaeensis]|uniref:penicillin-binding transpeptidase domain-containing protein n=1 Tax=Enorma phocaeensis TaxID=1871019 RepID=UPI002356281B
SGGLAHTPHFLESHHGEEVDWIDVDTETISAEAAEAVTSMMVTVVDEGTGSGGQVAGYDVAGKTGTAERASEEGGYQENNFMASFMGFAPASDPKALVYVTLDGTAGSGGGQAAPPFAAVMAQTLSILGVDPTR